MGTKTQKLCQHHISIAPKSPAEDYFDGFVLGVTKDATGARHNMEDFGSIRWQLVLSLLGAWGAIQ